MGLFATVLSLIKRSLDHTILPLLVAMEIFSADLKAKAEYHRSSGGADPLEQFVVLEAYQELSNSAVQEDVRPPLIDITPWSKKLDAFFNDLI